MSGTHQESKGILGSVTDMFSSAATAVGDGVGKLTGKVKEAVSPVVPSPLEQANTIGAAKEGSTPMLGGRRKSKKGRRRGRKSIKGGRHRKTRKH